LRGACIVHVMAGYIPPDPSVRVGGVPPEGYKVMIREFVHSRTGAVIAGSTVLVTLGGVGGAFAAGQIRSSDIKDQTIMRRDIGAGGVGSSEVKDQSIKRRDIGRGGVGSSEVKNGTLGMRDLNDATKSKINEGGSGLPGLPGADGAAGADGADGAPGLPGEIQTFTYNPATGDLTITTDGVPQTLDLLPLVG